MMGSTRSGRQSRAGLGARAGTGLAIALLIAACGGNLAFVSPIPTPSAVRSASPTPQASAADFGTACTAAYDALTTVADETQTMLEAYLAGDATKMLAQAGRVSLMAEQAVDALPADYRDQTALRLFAERVAVIQTFTTLEGELLDVTPFSEAMVELLDVAPALSACAS